MQTLTISIKHLRNLVKPVLPLAGRDPMLPVLMGVQIESHGKWLTALATDRFRVGMKRIAAYDSDGQPCEWPEFKALISVATLKSILDTFKGPRHVDPELTLAAEGMTLEVEAANGLLFSRASIAYELVDGEYPKVAQVLKRGLETEGIATDTAFATGFMAGFKHVGTTLQMKRGGGEKDPIFVTDCEDFIGALMPRKLMTDHVSAPWDDILTATPKVDESAKTPAKRTAKKKASAA